MNIFFWKNKTAKEKNDNRGSTLVEMIVCFALLGIFMACAAVFIATITNLFYEIKGETYSRQVSDIILQKVESELDGAKYDESQKKIAAPNPVISTDYKSITLYDKTDTLVQVKTDNKRLVVHYDSFSVTADDPDDSYVLDATDWKFNDGAYNGFTIEEMYLIPASKIETVSGTLGVNLSDYQLDSIEEEDYQGNVVVALLSIKNPKYGTFNTYRFIKMYNLSENYWNITSTDP